jgi:hypothetical protein
MYRARPVTWDSKAPIGKVTNQINKHFKERAEKPSFRSAAAAIKPTLVMLTKVTTWIRWSGVRNRK